jgi:tetratricopeptide (TPR) repeat protein
MKRAAGCTAAVILAGSVWAGAALAQAQQIPPAQQAAPPVEQQADVRRTPRELEEMRADLLMVRKRYSEALAAYEAILKKEPKNAPLLNKVGMAYHHLMKLGDAKKYYDRSIKADKTFAPAHNNLGTVHYNRKKYSSAIKAYKNALQLRDDIASVHSNLGIAYFAQKKYDEAFLCFHRALAIDPGVFEQRGGAAGELLQDRTVEDRRLFFFFLAKAFASQNNAERTAFYLRKALDEGYSLAAVPKDPAFVSVVGDVQVQDVLRAAGIVPPVTPPPKSE